MAELVAIISLIPVQHFVAPGGRIQCMHDYADDSRALVAEIIGGNHQAFQVFVEKYQRLVSHVVFRMVTNRSDREDLCQEVFFKVYRSLSGFEFGSKLSTWVARITYNTCINYLQKKKVVLLEDLKDEEDGRDSMETAAGFTGSLEEDIATRDLFERVQTELKSMPPQYAAVLTLYHLDEMTYEEIVDITDLPMGTVKSYLYRSRRMLKERLNKKYRTEDIWQQGT